MKRHFLLIIIFFLFSCQTLPVIMQPVSLTDGNNFVCPYPFLIEKYRFVHGIDVHLLGGAKNAVIGITVADPSTRSISCAIVTAEGMALFEGTSGRQGLKVNRALPPFDSGDFAKNMMDDISLIFFSPKGKLVSRGYFPDGSVACRYKEENGDVIDVIDNESDGKQIKCYTSSGTLKRHIFYDKAAKDIYQRIELQAYETFDYFLLMNLIEAQPLKARAVKRK